MLSDQNEDSQVSDDILASQKEDICFEELCHGTDVIDDNSVDHGSENESWGLLNSRVLARIFHFLRKDVKSLISSAYTCKRWNAASKYYRSMCRFVDLSSVGHLCSDSVFHNIMVCLTYLFEL